MRADKVEMSWDASKSQWVVRMQSGDEVIRRRCKLDKGAKDEELRAVAQQTVTDEGYELDAAAQIQIQR